MSTTRTQQQRARPSDSSTSREPGSRGKADATAPGSVLVDVLIAAVARGPLDASAQSQPLDPPVLVLSATTALLTGATPAVDMPGSVMIPCEDETMPELYAPQAVPAYGDNDGIAIGLRVADVETASAELAAADAELLGEITRAAEIEDAYRHVRGPDGRVYVIKESKPQPAQG